MESQASEPRDLFHRVWEDQVAYNCVLRGKESKPQTEWEQWMETYLLGLISEVDEVLDQMAWKRNRVISGDEPNLDNVARELADITKFVLSMWELNGFTPEQMLQYVAAKNRELQLQYDQDFNNPIPEEATSIVITDLDGTVVNWRGAFLHWLANTYGIIAEDKVTTLNTEVDIGIPYPRYLRLKDEFEASGGYRNIRPYTDALWILFNLEQHGIPIVAFTARPSKKHSRVWGDTWGWIEDWKLSNAIRVLKIGGEERIAYACAQIQSGRKVVMLDDDPGLCLRAANAGVTVIMRAHPYNEGITHSLINRVETFHMLGQNYLDKWMPEASDAK